ncbi:TonB-dependent receptor domain-containing protein [Allosphingosinicella deserti]|uniref:TonB-dependent receptor n=1 Tax=Allosphingosinicella deserti TaxID=2116704 RepID=A0A2P7QP34_9SPHN|nr:TonB-dependent receptor [Sphingomonas deserti]PSJ39733.1 TonB-dependent receptor [Sphingomonas deserti]
MHKHLRYGCASLALLAGTFAGHSSAYAQSTLPPENPESGAGPSAEQSGDAIVVTGSRIRRDPLSQDAPIVFVDSEDIAKTGLNSVNDVLQRLPSSGGGLNGKFNNSGNLGNPPDGGGVGAGAAEIDLRYLGSRRVLVLIDGIRFVNGASASGVPGSTDLNAIPESAIERIEVLQDGASAIYGSDAIAGVVNIITKKRQAGFLASAQIGTTDHGDGTTQNYQLSWGNKGDGPLQLVVGGNYVKTGGISAGDRDISGFPPPYATGCDSTCSSFTPNGRYFVFGQSQTLRSPVIGRPSTPADFRPFVSPGDRFNFAPFNYLQIPIERYGAFANLKYEVTPDINFSLRGIWNQRKSKNQAAPLPFGVGVAAGITPVLDATSVDATNPYNPYGVTLDASNTQFIYRRFVEGGPRQFSQDVETTYGVATLDGKFQIGERDWYWDLNGTYGRNKASQRMLGNIDSSKLRQALGPLAACTAPCVPFNLFGGAGSITQQMIDFVTFEQNDSSRQSTWDLTGNLTGSLLDLPGGPLGVALGVEYRDLSGRFDPDPVVAAGFSSDIPAGPTKGSYSVKEAYLEINAPLLSDRPFFQLLELNGAVRFSDYSLSGSTTTLKGGVNWKPIKALRLRASYAEGFRAPSIGELFGTFSRFDQQLDDPCSSHPDNTAPRRFANDAAVRQNCIAAGVPANGSYEQANSQISVRVGGNQSLTPETSRSWVVGGVLSPLPRLSIEANYYDIEIHRAIQSFDAEVRVSDCIVDNDPAACALTTRAGGGQLTQVAGILENIAAVKTDGIDLNLAYRTGETGVGRFGVTWNNTFLLNYDVQPSLLSSRVLSREGTEQGSPSQGFPKWKAVGILDWDLANHGVSLTGRYISKLKEAGGNVMKARFYTDFQLRISAGEDNRFGFALGVNNLFDTKAPGCVTCDINNFDPTVYDLPGRYLYARATVKM